MARLRAARDNHLPPTVFWGRHLRSPQRWNQRDLALAEALRIYEDGLCSGCGHPALHAYDPFNAGEFELLDDIQCLACEQRERDESKTPPGVKKYVKNLMGT